VADAHERNVDLLEGAIVFEVEVSEFAGTEKIVDVNDGMDLFDGITVFLDVNIGFEKLDLERELRGIVGGSQRRLLSEGKRSELEKNRRSE
jgi:hypothetical protein